MKYRKQWSGQLWKLSSFWYDSLVNMQILVLFLPSRAVLSTYYSSLWGDFYWLKNVHCELSLSNKWREMKKVMSGRHRLLLLKQENLAVSLIYTLIFRFIETLTVLILHLKFGLFGGFCPWVVCLMYFWILSPYEIYDLEISSVNL